MIIKFLSRKSNSGQLLQYICRYIFDEKKLQKEDLILHGIGSKQDKFLIRHNIRSRSIKGFLKEFNENESYRLVHRKDSVKVFHTIISFSPKDRKHLNDKILKNIAKKFIEERGMSNLYIGTKHEDKDHLHLHLCSSGTQLNGRSARVSNQKFRSIKLSLDRYQREKYPFLANSLPEHGKGRRLAKEALLSTLKANRQTNKVALLEALEKIYSQSRSKDEFLSKMKADGHEPYLRNGKLQGILFNGTTKYRFSRLGFGQERFEILDQAKKNEENCLVQLRSLRKGLQKEIEPGIERRINVLSKVNDGHSDLTTLDELATIRLGAKMNYREKDDDYQRAREINEDILSPIEISNSSDSDTDSFPVLITKLLPTPKT
ncbi:MAG: relaxase/mobilization nuclease domain-containing protein [Chitinophagaceae bacterium]|nr:relaxase/mobilization nuclease domain-containing protein [Chitinophagaceae bacterium]